MKHVSRRGTLVASAVVALGVVTAMSLGSVSVGYAGKNGNNGKSGSSNGNGNKGNNGNKDNN